MLINFDRIYLNCRYAREEAAQNALEEPRHVADLLAGANLSADFAIRRNDPLFQPERRRLNNIPRLELNRPHPEIRMFYNGQSIGTH